MENGLLETHTSSLYSFQNSRLHKHTLISEKPGKNICSHLKIWQEKKFHFSISISFFLFKKAVWCLLSEACLHQQMWTPQSVEAYLYTTVTGKSQKNTLIRSLSTKRHQNSFGASDSTGHVYEVTPEVTHDVTVPLKTLPSSSGQKTCKNETTTHLKNLKLWCPQLPRFMRNTENNTDNDSLLIIRRPGLNVPAGINKDILIQLLLISKMSDKDTSPGLPGVLICSFQLQFIHKSIKMQLRL